MSSLKMPKPGKYGTIRRSSLLKLVESGVMEAKCNFHYTDDYAWDNANNHGRTDWLQARIRKVVHNDITGRDERDFIQGQMNFDESDFDGIYRTGGARMNDDGTISFSIHSNLNYTLRVKKDGAK